MRRDDQRELDEALSEGFFADRLIELVQQGGPIDKNSREVLERAISKVDMVLSGLENVESGRIGSKAVENIHAYKKAIEIPFDIEAPDRFREEFRAAIQRIRTELRTSLERNAIQPDRLKETRLFFDAVRKATLKSSATFFREGANAPTWQSASP